MLDFFIKLPVTLYGVTNFFFGFDTTLVIFLSLKKFCIISELSFEASQSIAGSGDSTSAGGGWVSMSLSGSSCVSGSKEFVFGIVSVSVSGIIADPVSGIVSVS